VLLPVGPSLKQSESSPRAWRPSHATIRRHRPHEVRQVWEAHNDVAHRTLVSVTLDPTTNPCLPGTSQASRVGTSRRHEPPTTPRSPRWNRHRSRDEHHLRAAASGHHQPSHWQAGQVDAPSRNGRPRHRQERNRRCLAIHQSGSHLRPTFWSTATAEALTRPWAPLEGLPRTVVLHQIGSPSINDGTALAAVNQVLAKRAQESADRSQPPRGRPSSDAPGWCGQRRGNARAGQASQRRFRRHACSGKTIAQTEVVGAHE